MATNQGGEQLVSDSEAENSSLLTLIRDRIADNAHLIDVHDPHFLQSVRDLVREYNDRAVQDPANSPDKIISRIVNQYWSELPLISKPASTVNEIVAKFGLNTHRFREVGLAPYDEIALLKAAVYAGFSEKRLKGHLLAKKALRILRHEAKNINIPMQGGNPVAEHISIAALERSIYAFRAYDELVDREAAEPITNIDEVLMRWADLAGHPLEVEDEGEATEPKAVDPESKVSIRRLFGVEVEDRIKGLRVIGRTLQESFGVDITVRYFETEVFQSDDEILETDSSFMEELEEVAIEKEKTDGVEGEGENGSERERTEYFSSDYVIAEVTQTLEDGQKLVHIIAESPTYGNACYVLRGDTLAAFSELLGYPLDWRSVFSYRKNTARQLGAKDFRHTEGASVPEKVLRHFALSVEDTLRIYPLKWFNSKKPIYDDKLQRTRHNRLPRRLAEHAEQMLPQIHARMMEWHGASNGVIRDLGQTAGIVTVEKTPLEDAGTQAERDIELENQTLKAQNEQLKLDKLQLERRVAEDEVRLRELERLFQEANGLFRRLEDK